MYNNVKGLWITSLKKNGQCQQLFVGCLIETSSLIVAEMVGVRARSGSGHHHRIQHPELRLPVSAGPSRPPQGQFRDELVCFRDELQCFRRWLISWSDRVSPWWVRVFPQVADFVKTDRVFPVSVRIFPQVADFVYLGRIKDLKSVMKTSTIQSRQMGKRENKSD